MDVTWFSFLLIDDGMLGRLVKSTLVNLAGECSIGRLSTDIDTTLLRVFAWKQVFSTWPLVYFTFVDFHFCILSLEYATIFSYSHQFLERDVVPLIRFRCLWSDCFWGQIILFKNLLCIDRNIFNVFSWAWRHCWVPSGGFGSTDRFSALLLINILVLLWVSSVSRICTS